MNEENKIICTCANLTEAQIKNYLKDASNLNITFEKFLSDTKAGTRCTACILDLETIYIKKNIRSSNFKVSDNRLNLSFKKKFYSFIDKLFPKLTIKNQNFFPIINIKNKVLKQEIWISNMEIISSTLKKKIKIDDVEVEVNLFNYSGKKIWSSKEIVKVNSKKIFEIPAQKLSKDNQSVRLGWAKVTRNFKINCSKGTTRPQIMVYTDRSCCAVHGQDVGFTNGSFHSSIYKPDEEDQIITFINPTKKKTNILIRSPQNVDDSIDKFLENNIKVEVPPMGTYYHILSKDIRFKNFNNKHFIIDWKGAGSYKSHVYCFSKNYQFVSLDHL